MTTPPAHRHGRGSQSPAARLAAVSTSGSSAWSRSAGEGGHPHPVVGSSLAWGFEGDFGPRLSASASPQSRLTDNGPSYKAPDPVKP